MRDERTRIIWLIAPLTLALALGACGSGGDDGTSLTGVFMNGAVEGVRYQTPTQSGLTDASGEFHYRSGETITFSLGNISLGSAAGASELSLFDLQGIEPLVSEVELRAELANRERVSGFDRVANIAMLLATLDNDRQLDNGIDVSGWEQQLAGTSLDLDVNFYEFPGRRGAGSLTAVKTVFSVDHGVPVAIPLYYLYQNLGIRVPAHLPVRRESDSGLDGSVDFAAEMAYDQWGRQVINKYDTSVGGGFEIVTEYEYDPLHRLVTSESRSSSGISRLTRRFDGSGNLVLQLGEDDDGADEILDDSSSDSYRYDSGGNLLESAYEQDDGADGAIDSRQANSRGYDGMGNLLVQTHEWDQDGDGIVERRVSSSNQYDDRGKLRERIEEVDGGTSGEADGVVDYRSTRKSRYDAAGRLAGERLEADRDADGVVDGIAKEDYAYDDSGSLVSRIVEADSDADGVVDSRHSYRYQYAGGRLAKSEFESHYPGSAGSGGLSRSVTEYVYHTNGQLQRRINTRTSGSGSLISRITDSFTYGPQGNLLTERSQREGEDSGYIGSNFEMTYRYAASDDGLLFLLNHYNYPALVSAFGDSGAIVVDHSVDFSATSPRMR